MLGRIVRQAGGPGLASELLKSLTNAADPGPFSRAAQDRLYNEVIEMRKSRIKKDQDGDKTNL